MKKVYVINDALVARMFLQNGWEVVNDDYQVDLVCFTGGEDVDPSYYGEEKHGTTYSNPKRDAAESHIFRQNEDVPKVGICRGGQFLNVMSGGKMWQHVDKHLVWHDVTTKDGKEVHVSSDHHQMMLPAEEAEILLTTKLSTFKETATKRHLPDKKEMDVEGCYYPPTLSLCVQYHPEYVGVDHESQQLFFQLIADKFKS